MRRPIVRTAALIILAGALGLTAEGRPPEDAGNSAVKRSGVDPSFVDPKVRPQDDLFRHVNGKWLVEAPIPPDRPLDGAFYKLRDQAEADLRQIIEQTASKP